MFVPSVLFSAACFDETDGLLLVALTARRKASSEARATSKFGSCWRELLVPRQKEVKELPYVLAVVTVLQTDERERQNSNAGYEKNDGSDRSISGHND